MAREDLEFLALRDTLAQMGVQTKSSEGNYEYFTAFTELDPETGNPGNGVFVYGRDGESRFFWGCSLNNHSMDDVSGAAQRIRAYVEFLSVLDKIERTE